MGKFLTAVSAALEFNMATLSGAMDVIVIQDPDGKRQSTPFHVRFGKLQLFKTRGIPINIEINGHRTSLRMYLGAAGEAYFYNPPPPLHVPSIDSSTDVADADTHPNINNDNILTNEQQKAETNTETVTATTTETLNLTVTETETETEIKARDEIENAKSFNTTTPITTDIGDEVAGTDKVKPPLTPPSPTDTTYPETSPMETTTKLPIPVEANCTIAIDQANIHLTASLSSVYTSELSPSSEKSPSAADPDFHLAYVSDSEVELTRTAREGGVEVVIDEPRSPPRPTPSRNWNASSSTNALSTTSLTNVNTTNNFPSDNNNTNTETREVVQSQSQPLHSLEESSDNTNFSLFGLPATETTEMKRPRRPRSSVQQQEVTTVPLNAFDQVVGEELHKLDVRSVDGYDPDDDDEQTDIDIHEARKLQRHVSRALSETDGISSFDVVSPIEQRERDEDVLSMSLCGDLVTVNMREEHVVELFDRHRLMLEDVAMNPNIVFDSRLMCRMQNRIVDFQVAVPVLMSALAFGRCLDFDVVTDRVKQKASGGRGVWFEDGGEEPEDESGEKIDEDGGDGREGEEGKQKEEHGRNGKGEGGTENGRGAKLPQTASRFGWFGWASPPVVGEPLLGEEDISALDANGVVGKDKDDRMGHVESGTGYDGDESAPPEVKSEDDCGDGGDTTDGKSIVGGDGNEIDGKDHKETENNVGLDENKNTQSKNVKTNAEDDSSQQGAESSKKQTSQPELNPDYLFLQPTPEQLQELPLEEGANSVRFYVDASAAELNCRIFLWSTHSKIIISDVDGTITRSDVLGHLLPAVGRDWSQVGVAGLYTRIDKNGYKVVYLTARPIGQASQTRTFLHGVTQGSAKLPNGPVLMSPNRLMESLAREVIRRKPHEFKIAALREVRCLFPPSYNPFHAGFGNRDTDVISYRAVGLIPQRIFVVNPRGELVVMKERYESVASYSTLEILVEKVFPDISGHGEFEKIEALTVNATFNDWNYWRGSLPEIDIDELLKQ